MSKHSLQDPVLVVDDEADIRDLMEMTLMKMGLSVETAVGVTDAKAKLDDNDYSLVLTDMRMPDGSGLEVVQYIDELMLDTPVAVITAFGNADHAVEALKAGAFDYLQKPITLSQLRSLVKSAVKVNEPEAEEAAKPAVAAPVPDPAPVRPTPARPISEAASAPLRAAAATAPAAPRRGVAGGIDTPMSVPAGLRSLKERFSSGESAAIPAYADEVGGDPDMPRLLGMSPQMEEARHLIRRLAHSNVPVYIAGESGSGKEQAARSIHELSERAGGAFIAVNCGAIPENLMESEFFGYKKGSFTGADADRLGFFQHADGGTLFLDEVADLPLAMQVKLLRAIQEKAVRRIGDAHETQIDVRIVCATHKNLEALVASGAFRQDLYYRLNVVSLHMPPLREMREDLGGLIMRLLNKHRIGNSSYRLSPKAQDALLHYSYPGNFRELENILERAVALTVGQIIQLEDLQIHNAHQAQQESPGRAGASFDALADPQPQISLSAGAAAVADFIPGQTQIQDYLDEIERRIIEQALQQTRYNRTQAAKLLGISFRSMRYRMERLDIN
ncbi:sigma-54 dependent transcriptional regulator [Uruburuella suis]|jgi:two-component system response regulator PilR (NtrC family)|uniref:Sigma-54 dependent transcriptional regulator n=1 Tax=Uruburuella suis TaxID=252130 RepID=A0AAE9KI97_9NEIS|nr:sigma-54 dependent transcriptional regulator [Uruburuella suis]MBP7258918.1 sigma-54-dependent Fis family transcriptional regulator [Neisseria sp.]MBP8043295.1 sigma-54-dependent Fis family transcriptional regulator [Neisseria sp.]MBP8875300.1 sigma-54-dependent Fis family transcriptional regulator [Neisseria sp.]TCO98842.1 two-component system response regulator PilR (NtrC family) [Uruburuella suis]UOO79742.1 sigma-54 dependent transcriptional regulator [Uruburuella suis]